MSKMVSDLEEAPVDADPEDTNWQIKCDDEFI